MVSGTYELNGSTCIRFGKIHPKTAMNFEIPDSVWYFECEYSELFNQYMSDIASGVQTYLEPNKYPIITRELNFVMESNQPTNKVGNLISSIDSRIQNVSVIDVFSHPEKIGIGKKSVSFRFSIVDRTKTITDEEALSLQNTCIETLGSKGFALRMV